MANEDIILKKYNKKFLLPVYSGTLAIEGVLKSLNLDSSAKVLITNVVCHSILQAILNANLTPVIAIPQNGLTLSEKEIEEIVKNEKIKVFIAVHQYGYVQKIVKIKDLIIIEDISQAWNIKPSNSFVGEYSDYIITSLGNTKPLNNGIGGLILSNINFITKFDIKKRECRDSKNPLIEYYYSLDINYKKIVKRADRKVARQRNNVMKFKKILSKYDFIREASEYDGTPSYHRYPIYIKQKEYERLLQIMDKCKISYQKEYKKKLNDINLVKDNNIKVIGNTVIDKCVLIKTNNKYLNIKKFDLEMRRNYES